MFNVFKKTNHQKKDSQWNEILKSRILPEENYYNSTINNFNEEFIKEEINQTYRPDLSLNDYLTTALYLTYANFNKQVATAYFKVALQIANTILELPKSEMQRWNDDNLFTDLFKPNISIDKLYLDALLTNKTIDATKLTQLNIDLLEYLKTYKRSLWVDVSQSWYLSSVWNLMIAGDFEQAKNYLNVKKKFPYVQNLYEWTKQINNLLIAKHSRGDNCDQLKDEF